VSFFPQDVQRAAGNRADLRPRLWPACDREGQADVGVRCYRFGAGEPVFEAVADCPQFDQSHSPFELRLKGARRSLLAHRVGRGPPMRTRKIRGRVTTASLTWRMVTYAATDSLIRMVRRNTLKFDGSPMLAGRCLCEPRNNESVRQNFWIPSPDHTQDSVVPVDIM
jgi:hypothetical protein